jgi:hypothetical protein
VVTVVTRRWMERTHCSLQSRYALRTKKLAMSPHFPATSIPGLLTGRNQSTWLSLHRSSSNTVNSCLQPPDTGRSTRYTLYYPSHQLAFRAMCAKCCASARAWLGNGKRVVVAYLSNLVALAPVHSSAFGDGFEEGCFSDIVKEQEVSQSRAKYSVRAVSFVDEDSPLTSPG